MLAFTGGVKAHTFPIDSGELAHNLVVKTDLSHHYFSKLAILYLSPIIYHKVFVLA